jgi:hypothetical protein
MGEKNGNITLMQKNILVIFIEAKQKKSNLILLLLTWGGGFLGS